jgi:hypothetical protein
MKQRKQEWLDYLAELAVYQEQVRQFAQSLPDGSLSADTSGENPQPPLPPQPPK